MTTRLLGEAVPVVGAGQWVAGDARFALTLFRRP